MDKADIKRKAREIASELKETQYSVQIQLQNMINLAGMDFVQATLDETYRIEAEGGIMTKDGTRRRTPGGVFFQVARETVSPDIRDKLFPPPNWKKRKAKKKSKANSSPEQKQSQDNLDSTRAVSPATAPVDASGKAEKLAKLEDAARALRERLAQLEAKGQKGVTMTRNLLKQTEQQIEKLRA